MPLEKQADFQLIIVALYRCGEVLRGIYSAETVEEIEPEDMNDAERSIGPAKDALARLQRDVYHADDCDEFALVAGPCSCGAAETDEERIYVNQKVAELARENIALRGIISQMNGERP